MTKLHDRLSDILHIRERFDISHILFPLALASGAACTVEQIWKIKRNRQDLMYKVFYKYASSSPGKSQIELHYITLALGAVVMVLDGSRSGICCFPYIYFLVVFFKRTPLGHLLLLLPLLCGLLLQFLQYQCVDYASKSRPDSA